MANATIRRSVAAVLALVMVLLILPMGTMKASAAETTYTLDTTTDLAAMAAGAKADGDAEAAGTDGFFTIYYSAKTKIDGSSKTFEDGYVGTQRLNFGGKSAFGDTIKNAIQIKVDNAATVKIWFVQGGDDNRQVAIFDAAGNQVAVSAIEGMLKNEPYIVTLDIPEAGTYFIGNPTNNNNFYKIEVTVEEVVSEPAEYALDTTADLAAMAAGAKADGDAEAAGTDGFFTIYYSTKAKIDSSSKTFEDGYVGTQRLNFGGKSAFGDTIKNAIQIKVDNAATVKIWFVQGGDDNRQVAIFDAAGNQVAVSAIEGMLKNDPYITTLDIPEAGTYFIGNPTNNNNFYKILVTVAGSGPVVKPPRADWSTVEAPVITSAADNGSGDMKVTVTAAVGYDGADEVVVVMTDAEGNELASKRSIAEKDEHTLTFTPEASGEYTFSATVSREGEEPKAAAETVTASFLLPLQTPAIGSGTSAGNGSVDLVWGAVKEATGYAVYVDSEKVAETTETEYTVTGLTVGQKYSFQVAALRGEEATGLSAAVEVVVTANAQRVWGFTRYGSSTNDANNGYVGSVNEDGKVTVYSEGGKGKIVPNSTDGLAFYYTAIPTEYNFTLRATVTVDSWTLSNAQEGFGLMASDRLGPNGDSASFWNNQYMALASKVEYSYDAAKEAVSDSGTKYSMKLGLGALAKTGLTPENLPAGAEMPEGFKTVTTPLETMAAQAGLEAGTYNIVGNATAAAPGTIAELTSFDLEIQKNNTGYFVTYYDAEGNVVTRIKDYDPDALSMLDTENVYVGFFAARNARITVSDIQLTTILATEDAPAEEKPVTVIEPSVTISSSTVTTSEDYTLIISTNVDGTAKITVGDTVIEEAAAITGGVRYDKAMKLSAPGAHKIVVVFTPDAEQDLGPDTVLSSADPVTTSLTVSYNADYAELVNLYVSPEGKPNAAGTREDPLDVYTAVDNVKAGQTIVVMEGTYKLSRTLTIQRGIDGTAENLIRMVADPQAATRPVFDFQGKCAGIVHGGNYWYFRGFDVTASQNGQKGFQVSGNYNTLDQINTYKNGNTGIQISRYSGADATIDQWPSYNLILNCTSYDNADAGYEDADGFAAKLTCGVGNVFDGCVAYNNADDGWDLYAKVETGPIGSVTIRNCVAYSNGYLSDGTNAGNGNGFKMGGESISGKHVLINSYAFFNKAKGIDSNSCPDIIVENSTSYNNESYNVAFYTNNAANTDFSATGIISFKDETTKSGLSTGENLKPVGTQDTSKYLGDTNYYWNGSASKNASGAEVTADMFVSLTFQGVKRNADGTIDLQGFLQLTDAAPDNAGANPGGTGSGDVELLPDPEKPEVTDPVVRIYGENRFETAFKVADELKAVLGVEKFNAIIIASGENFADALSGSYLASVKNAPILLAYDEEYNALAAEYIKANLAENGTVYILGGTAAVSENMETLLAGYTVKRLAGETRFETNLLILEEAGVVNEEILVTTGVNFADSLSASATGLPILLVNSVTGELTEKQIEFLSDLYGNDFTIVGGTAAVGKKIEDALWTYGEVVRLSGKTRFETSVMVSERFFTEHFEFQPPEAIVLAYAANFPDGLCGGVLAHAMNAPIILTMDGYETEAAAYAKAGGIDEGLVLGGTGLIGDDTVRTIFGLDADHTVTVK